MPDEPSARSVDVSVILCTRNRAGYLSDTLQSFDSVRVPANLCAELILVDNGSTDATQQVIQEADLDQFDLRVLYEAKPGVSRARNHAVRHAHGNVLLFTDDDVRVPAHWLVGMTTPIRSGEADAVAGGVIRAPHLQRPWQAQDPWLTTPLATTAVLDADDPQRLVGANMALRASIFDVVPPFDTELGPGTERGLGEETLLTHQLKHHGFRVTSAFDVTVEHHCSSERLKRHSYLKAAEKIGRSQGYIDYHWKRNSTSPLHLVSELLLLCGQLVIGRSLWFFRTPSEGMPGWEMALLTRIYHIRALLAERGRPPNYAAFTID